MSISVNLHLDAENVSPTRVLFVEPIVSSGTLIAAVDVDGATIFFRTCAQIRQLIDTLWDAERRLFALENPEMQDKAVDANSGMERTTAQAEDALA